MSAVAPDGLPALVVEQAAVTARNVQATANPRERVTIDFLMLDPSVFLASPLLGRKPSRYVISANANDLQEQV